MTSPSLSHQSCPVSSPYSYSCKRLPKDAEDLMEAALGASNALKKVHGTDYKASLIPQFFQSVDVSYAVPFRPEACVPCSILRLEISSTGCTPVKLSNTHTLRT